MNMAGVGGRIFDINKKREGAASRQLASRRLPYALARIAYGGCLGTQGTYPARRGDIGEDAGNMSPPAINKFPKSVKNVETVEIPDSRGVWGQ